MTLNIKSTIATITILALFGFVVAIGATAATESGVAATVTVENIAVSVSDGTVEYGTLGVNTQANTVTLTETQTATNDGNVNADLAIRGEASTGSWTLAGAAGNEQYKHEFSTDGGSTYTPLTTSNQDLALGVSASANQTFDLQITTPTVTTDFSEQTANVTVQVSASS